MSIAELKQAIEDKKAEVRSFTDAKNLDGAKSSMEELRDLQATLKIEEELAEQEQRELEQQNIENREDGFKVGKVNEVRSFTKAVIGSELSPEERAVIVSTGVGTVIPKEFVNKLEEVRKGYAPLKGLCDVIPVTKAEGSVPVVDLDQNEMKDLTEGDDIVDGSLVTTDIKFKVSSVGLIDKFSFESVEDAEFSLEEIATKNFAEIAVRKENKRIIDAINTGAVVSTSTKVDLHQKLVDEMAKVVPSAKAGLVTLVNTAAYSELKNKEDKNGRPLNLITEINGVEYFNLKPIYIVDDVVLPELTEEKTMLAYVGNIKEAIKFFDRKQVTIARAEKFENGAKMVRVLERIDVKPGTIRSLRKIEM